MAPPLTVPDKLSPESVWLYLYGCHTEILCDPAKAAEHADIAYAAFMERFAVHTVKRPRPDDKGRG